MFWGGNAEGKFADADRKTFFQRLGARDLPSGGRADGHKQSGFTPAVNAMPVVQVTQLVQRVLRKRDCVFFGRLREKRRKKIGGKVPPDGIVAEL